MNCGVERYSLHKEHIIPKIKGGTNDLSNIQFLCANCHEDKTRIDMKGVVTNPHQSQEQKDKHSIAMKKYWASLSPEERNRRALQSAATRMSRWHKKLLTTTLISGNIEQ